METEKINQSNKGMTIVPQVHVRSDLRAGDEASDLATCQSNVEKWKQRYQDAYNEAKQKGCI